MSETFRKVIKEALCNGSSMNDEQANIAIEAARGNDSSFVLRAMKDRWDTSIDGYSPTSLVRIFQEVNRVSESLPQFHKPTGMGAVRTSIERIEPTK